MNKKSKPLLFLTTLVAIVLVGLIMGLTHKKPVIGTTSIDTTGQPTIGKANAPVSVVVFEDLKCPVCAEYSNTISQKVVKKYVLDGTVKYTIITLAFIPGSIPAGNAALCLYKKNKDYFFPFVEYLYQHQGPEPQDWATAPALVSFARQAIPSLSPEDQKELSNCILSGQPTSTLSDNLNLAEKVMSAQGVATPTVYVNGKVVSPLTETNLEAAIKQAQKSAR